MLASLEGSLGKDYLLSPVKKVYKFNFMKHNAQDVLSQTLTARQERVKAINYEI